MGLFYVQVKSQINTNEIMHAEEIFLNKRIPISKLFRMHTIKVMANSVYCIASTLD